ncbi:MAG: hypothetical protein QM702_03385 [Rubrivivax sp.]
MAFDGDVDGGGDYTGNVRFERGFDLGSSVGTDHGVATVDAANIALTATTISRFDLVNGTAGGFDRLVATGSVAVDGQLVLDRDGAYVPAYGTAHRIIQAATRSGTFDTVAGVTISPQLALAVTYDATGVVVTAALPGDADLDRTVDFDDLLALAGTTTSRAAQRGPTATSTAAAR